MHAEWVCHAINPEGPDELGEITWIQKNVARRSAVDIRTRRGEPFLLSVNSIDNLRVGIVIGTSWIN